MTSFNPIQITPIQTQDRAELSLYENAEPTHAHLLGVGTACPSILLRQDEIECELASLWQLRGRRLERWRRICRNAGVDQRFGVRPIIETISMSTAERMELFSSHAPKLAELAATNALRHANISAARITDLIIVSCTGFSAPGLDVALIRQLGLQNTVRRCMIGFMGCFGAINGIRAAVGACAANTDAVALVVCCELCSLHVNSDVRPDNQVACALFGDGAAAAVVAAGTAFTPSSNPGSNGTRVQHRSLGRFTTGQSQLIADTTSMMSWRVTDSGFAMTLSRAVPSVLRDSVRPFVEAAGGKFLGSVIPHPGGPDILDALRSALDPNVTDGIDCSADVLREFGNMSSSTVLFALERLCQQSAVAALPALLIAFGPGLTIDSVTLR